ncbi:MAG: Bax inhibitor-1/YccA family protein [Puniceicoccales bacterium]|jgi:uncharacterized YccA/Bax inhibitor family protein|nr:Bax inhibitor-1/YccA family protein [Puniceicoccales bacterium]
MFADESAEAVPHMHAFAGKNDYKILEKFDVFACICKFCVLDCGVVMWNDVSNPILSRKNFRVSDSGEMATMAGTVNRCLILLGLVFASAAFSWVSLLASPVAVGPKVLLFLVLAVVTAVVTCVKKEWSGITAPLYAVFEGLVLGAISMVFELAYHGIVFQAVMLTFGVALGMLLLYRSGVIKVTEKFKMVVASALFGIFIFYAASWILSLFGVSASLSSSTSIFGLVFSAFVVVVAALSLAVDFDFIVEVSDSGLPKYMSWFAAFGLMVGLVYLYVQILHLLAKLRDR